MEIAFDHCCISLLDACKTAARHLAQIDGKAEGRMLQIHANILVLFPPFLTMVLDEICSCVARDCQDAISNLIVAMLNSPPGVWVLFTFIVHYVTTQRTHTVA